MIDDVPPEAWLPTPSGEALTVVVDDVAHARLNRPRALNALSTAMVADLRAKLAEWDDDALVSSVVIDGAGERGLCAGADVRAVRDMVLAQDLASADAFFREEYGLFADVAHFGKPVTAVQRGIVMGGGLALSAAARDSVVGPDATLAMPETQIGFAPDAGAMWWLSRGGELGLHLALTGSTFNAADALRLTIADRGDGTLPAPAHDPAAPWLAAYRQSDPVAILEALRADGSDGATAAAEALAARCPTTVWVAFRAWQRARTMTWDQVIEQDLRIAAATVRSADFVEGVRAQLVDKDKQPRWSRASLADVTDADVDPYLA